MPKTGQGDRAADRRVVGGSGFVFGLQARFTVLVLCLTLSVAALVGVVVVDLVGQLGSRQKREQCVQISALLARSSVEAMQRSDEPALQQLAEKFCTGDPILFVTFTDTNGRWLAGAGVEPRPASSSTSILARGARSEMLGQPVFVDGKGSVDAHLRVSYPVRRSDESGKQALLGYVAVGLNVEHTLKDLASAVDLFIGVSISVLVIAIPLAFLVVRCVVVPLKELSGVVRRFAQGDFGARSTLHRGDEIGALARSFNRMADELEQKHQQIVAFNADLEQRVRTRTEQLRELAAREPLTGLYNRRHFGEVLERRFSEATRYGSDLSCIMMDLDNFKDSNDRFGHYTGDEVLILVATTVASQLRAADVAARFGGDEFVILLPQTPGDRAWMLAERIMEKFGADLAEQLPEVRVTLSVGIASLAETGADSAEALVRAADQAMYRAKDAGKGRIESAAVSAKY
ncbi:MAG: diguanylate cyclase [Phycisphaerae bacterium]